MNFKRTTMLIFSAALVALLTGATNNSPHVILITLDGVRHQEIFNGSDTSRDEGNHLTSQQIVPSLYHSFVGQGIAVGKSSSIIASGPNHISLPGYLEITRGHTSTDCQTNSCYPVLDQSIFYLFQNAAMFSSWETIGRTVPNNPNYYKDVGTNYYRDDVLTQQIVLSYLDYHTPDFLWVALGDTDERAHEDNYQEYLTALHNADAFIGLLVKKYPDATFIITTDHGRSNNFKDHGADKTSERVWLMMRGKKIPALGIVKTKSISLSNIFYTINDLEYDNQSPMNITRNIIP